MVCVLGLCVSCTRRAKHIFSDLISFLILMPNHVDEHVVMYQIDLYFINFLIVTDPDPLNLNSQMGQVIILNIPCDV